MKGKYEASCDQDQSRGEECHQEPSAEEAVQVASRSDCSRHPVQQTFSQTQRGGEGGSHEGEEEQDGGLEGVVPEDNGVEAGVASYTCTS